MLTGHAVTFSCFLLCFYQSSLSLITLGTCRYALGVQDGRVTDNQLSASSQWYGTTAAKYGRLEGEEGDGAWCPKGPVQQTPSEFLQVRLGGLYMITLAGTQGRHSGGLGKEFASHYHLHYTRDGQRWRHWRGINGDGLIQANTNTYSLALHDLSPPLVAIAVRFLPVSPHPAPACMRVELYGCPWTNNVMSYKIPLGQKLFIPQHGPVCLNDSSYDGNSDGAYLYDGLGQLMDGTVGQDLVNNPKGLDHDYVGWHKDKFPSSTISLELFLNSPHNLTALQLHCGSNAALEITPFSLISCRIAASPAGPWLSSPIASLIPRISPLPESVASSSVVLRASSASQDRQGSSPSLSRGQGTPRGWVSLPLGGHRAGALACTLHFKSPWLLLSEIALITQGQAVYNTSDNPWYENMETFGEYPDITEERFLFDNKNGIDVNGNSLLIGCLLAIIFLLLLVIAAILSPRLGFCTHQGDRLVQLSCNSVFNEGRQHGGSSSGEQDDGMEERQEAGNSGGYEDPRKLVPEQMPELPQSAEDAVNQGEYTEPDLTRATPRPLPVTYYATAQVAGELRSSVIESLPGPLPPEFPRNRLRPLQLLGQGQFGEVHLCEADGLWEILGEEPEEGLTTSPAFVAVKMRHPEAGPSARADFLHEVRVLTRLQHPKVLRVLAACLSPGGPIAIVTEFMAHGDLHQYLNSQPEEELSTSRLLSMALQVAQGMNYLASINFIHRDLAARNCLVGKFETVKVGDVGMGRSLYTGDYYRVKGRALLPIRWLAPESLLLGKFSLLSDVWAFGVLLWELLSKCREQPYTWLSDEQVVSNAANIFQGHPHQELLPCPVIWLPALCSLMLSCWEKEPTQRPLFPQIINCLEEQLVVE
uniref:discoidin domain-containing receptor 2-like isoform X1 n=1 Tax=Myxine glutinosa TaxID=7769 RepID=UPI00358EDD9B